MASYIGEMLEWLKNPANQVPRTPNTNELEPSLNKMCEIFAVTRANKDVGIALQLFRESMVTTKPTILQEYVPGEESWYTNEMIEVKNRPIWNRLQSFLLTYRKWSVSAVTDVDSASDMVVNALRNPNVDQEFQHRGMVVGHVQSGKTTNMSAVIAKASDAGYRCIIVLAGVLDTLRQQTQFRFQQELFGNRKSVFTGHQQDAPRVETDDACKIKAVTDCHPDDPSIGEINEERLNALFYDCNSRELWNTTRVFVIKKTTTRLELLTEFFKSLDRVQVNGKFDIPTLVIDDECDQATINTKFRKGDVTAINKSIRLLLLNLRRNSYVGYTATPFANIFIDPYSDDKDLGRDLYPKDFILTLNPPAHYLGTKELFGILNFNDPDADQEPLDIFVDIPESEHKALGSKSAKTAVNISSEENKTLYAAVLDFILSCALQEKRNLGEQDMTMLIHPSAYKNIQNRIFEPLLKLVEALQRKRTDEKLHTELKIRLENNFNPRSRAMRKLSFHAIPDVDVKYEEIKESINNVIGKLEMVLLHGDSGHVLKYHDTSNPKRYIVVGGNKLSRGLTLEGLSVSFFLRKSATYDTLLQMGRWFGYRAKYVDLTRLYISEQMRDFFSHLAYVELDMRSKFAQNYLDAKTPVELPTHIAKITGLNIVANNKMGAASVITESYSGRFLEQTRIDAENPSRILERNNMILGWLSSFSSPELLYSSKADKKLRMGSYIWKNPLTSEQLAKFLESIDLGNMKKDLILKALRNQRGNNEIGALKWYITIGGKEKGSIVTKIKCEGKEYPIVSVNRKLKNIPSSIQLLRLISGTEVFDYFHPMIASFGDDPNKVGIVCVYFVNSNEEVLWGDRIQNPAKLENWSNLGVPFIASVSLIVPTATQGTMYVGLKNPENQIEDDMEVESDD